MQKAILSEKIFQLARWAINVLSKLNYYADINISTIAFTYFNCSHAADFWFVWLMLIHDLQDVDTFFLFCLHRTLWFIINLQGARMSKWQSQRDWVWALLLNGNPRPQNLIFYSKNFGLFMDMFSPDYLFVEVNI